MDLTLITGATGGLGKAFAEIYAREGHNLLLVGRNQEKLEALKASLLEKHPETSILLFACDLAKKESWEAVKSFVESNGHFVETLVNNAGFGDRNDLIDMDIDTQIEMNEVNCNAVLYFCHAFLPKMAGRKQGHVINVASIAGFYPGAFMCTYHASKAYVLNLSQALAYEMKKSGVKVLALCPGPFESEFVGKAHNDFTFEKIKPIPASEVAEYGYKQSQKGKTIAVVGAGNRITVFASRFLGRNLITKITAKTLKKDA